MVKTFNEFINCLEGIAARKSRNALMILSFSGSGVHRGRSEGCRAGRNKRESN